MPDVEELKRRVAEARHSNNEGTRHELMIDALVDFVAGDAPEAVPEGETLQERVTALEESLRLQPTDEEMAKIEEDFKARVLALMPAAIGEAFDTPEVVDHFAKVLEDVVTSQVAAATAALVARIEALEQGRGTSDAVVEAAHQAIASTPPTLENVPEPNVEPVGDESPPPEAPKPRPRRRS